MKFKKYIVLSNHAAFNLLELNYHDRKRIHNLKYFTWVEPQGRRVKEFAAQWYDYPDYWTRIQNRVMAIDEAITAFNQQTGLLG